MRCEVIILSAIDRAIAFETPQGKNNSGELVFIYSSYDKVQRNEFRFAFLY